MRLARPALSVHGIGRAASLIVFPVGAAMAADVATRSIPLAVVMTLGMTAAAGGLRSPWLAAGVGVALIAVVPIYWVPAVPGPIQPTPALGVAICLLPAAVRRLDRLALGAMDAAMVSLVACLGAAAYTHTARLSSPAVVGLTTALPYAVFRVLAIERRVRDAVAAGIVVAALPLTLVAFHERTSGGNPFFDRGAGGYESGIWAHADARFGTTRAEASFGHPIAFGMFLAMALLVCTALLLRRPKLAVPLIASLGLLVMALVATLSRGPILGAAVGVVLLLARAVGRRRFSSWRAIAALVMLGGVLLLAPSVRATLDDLRNATLATNTAEAQTYQYRTQLFRDALSSSRFSLLGQGQTVADAASATGVSVDSEYVLVYETAGLLTLLALVACVVQAVRGLRKAFADPFDALWPVMSCMLFVCALTVALITQVYALMFVSLAMTGAVMQAELLLPSEAARAEQGRGGAPRTARS